MSIGSALSELKWKSLYLSKLKALSQSIGEFIGDSSGIIVSSAMTTSGEADTGGFSKLALFETWIVQQLIMILKMKILHS